MLGGGGNVAIEAIYMYWCLTRMGLCLSGRRCRARRQCPSSKTLGAAPDIAGGKRGAI